MKKKIVCVIKDEELSNQIRKKLLDHNIADFRFIKLGEEYEQVIRQEMFLSCREWRITLLGLITGTVLGALIMTQLSAINEFAILLGRMLASGISAAAFTGAGAGMALGGLLAGLYAMSDPLPGEYYGKMLLVLFCKDNGEAVIARNITGKDNWLSG